MAGVGGFIRKKLAEGNRAAMAEAKIFGAARRQKRDHNVLICEQLAEMAPEWRA